MILDVEHHQVVVAERIEGTENEGRGEGTEERPPQGLEGEIVAHLDTGINDNLNKVSTIRNILFVAPRIKMIMNLNLLCSEFKYRNE